MWNSLEATLFSVIIPTLNNGESISELVNSVRGHPLIKEVMVVDDGSTDETSSLAREAGATVILSSMLGKGASMHDGLLMATAKNILFLEGNIRSLPLSLIDLMNTALERDADFVKARFSSTEEAVSLFAARPLINIYFPALASISQPLCGIVAASRQYLLGQVFEDGYGVEIGLLIDAHLCQANIVEIDAGAIAYITPSQTELSSIAGEVVQAILDRANKCILSQKAFRRIATEPNPPSPIELSALSRCVRSRAKIALIDLDVILVEGSFLAALARQLGRERALDECVNRRDWGWLTRQQEIASVFAGVSRQAFISVAKNLPVSPDVIDMVIKLKRQGFTVGVVTDRFQIMAEIIRKRIFADFGIGHELQFDGGVVAGPLLPHPFFLAENGCKQHEYCKQNIIFHLERLRGSTFEEIISIGNASRNQCLLAASTMGFSLEGRKEIDDQGIIHLSSCPEIMTWLSGRHSDQACCGI